MGLVEGDGAGMVDKEGCVQNVGEDGEGGCLLCVKWTMFRKCPELVRGVARLAIFILMRLS